jgi:hypothetical protein
MLHMFRKTVEETERELKCYGDGWEMLPASRLPKLSVKWLMVLLQTKNTSSAQLETASKEIHVTLVPGRQQGSRFQLALNREA